MVFAFSALAHLFTDLTLGSALVQRRTIGEEERSTVFWTSAGAGLLLTLVGLAVAGPIADFYGEPEVRSLFAAVSLLFAVGGLATTQSALLARSLRFRANELIAIAAALAGGAAAVAVAAAGGGAWAFVAQRAGTTVVTTGAALGRVDVAAPIDLTRSPPSVVSARSAAISSQLASSSTRIATSTTS